jgi:hypothetical protein
VPKTSKRLVIDASIASASGETMHPTSRRCREFLDETRKICHRMVLTRHLADEWRKHQSRFAAEWIIDMRNKGKVVDLVDVSHALIRDQLAAKGKGNIRKAAQKDLHLVEAALATDKTVVSLHEIAHEDLMIEATAKITWVNADAEGGHAIYWLRHGAKPVKKWQLGYGRS